MNGQAVRPQKLQAPCTIFPWEVAREIVAGWSCLAHRVFKVGTGRGGIEYRTCPVPACPQFERFYQPSRREMPSVAP